MIRDALDVAPSTERGSTSARLVRSRLATAAARLRAEGVTIPPLEGKLLRPLVAYALVPPALRADLDGRFWTGALAVQMIHEASLLHDDILDQADERRGSRTLVAEGGQAAALVLGDLYLTGGYRAAASTGIPRFLEAFIHAVERTVVGEVLQAEAAGQILSPEAYQEVVEGKSGELFGAAAVLGATALELGQVAERRALGRQLGALYQRVDDLLDYCPSAGVGKPPLQDYRQQKWTWVLDLIGTQGFAGSESDVLDALHETAPGGLSPARLAVEYLRDSAKELLRRTDALAPGDTLVANVLDGWVDAAERAVRNEEAQRPPRRVRTVHRPSRVAEVAEAAKALGGQQDWLDYFGRHARTFRFAAHLFPAPAFRSTTRLYAFCRFTDDLVDEPWDQADHEVVNERLAAWSELARAAFEGRRTDVPLLDDVLGEAFQVGVDRTYLEAFLSGIRMDLERQDYEGWADLERYTFGVAGAVGGWMTQLFGLREPGLLDRAHDLGHAMQLTNIVRDVGEDLERGRLYLPRVLLARHGVRPENLLTVRRGRGPLPPGYPALMEEMIAAADRRYEDAWQGIERLPSWYGRPAAAAAGAYRAIHDAVRRNRHDTLRHRASTSIGTKMVRGGGAVVRSMAARSPWSKRLAPGGDRHGPAIHRGVT